MGGLAEAHPPEYLVAEILGELLPPDRLAVLAHPERLAILVGPLDILLGGGQPPVPAGGWYAGSAKWGRDGPIRGGATVQ